MSRTPTMTRAMTWGAIALACWGSGVRSTMAAEPTASAPGLERFEYEEVQMGVGFKVVLYAADRGAANRAARKALDRVAELNGLLSDYQDESELNKLCRAFGKDVDPQPAAGIAVSPEFFTVVSHAQRLSEQTQGAFDVSVGPMVRLWRRARRQKELPSEARLAEARTVVGYPHIRLDPQTRTIRLAKPGMQLDLGGIAKGYAADEALAVLKREGITRALVGAAGDIAAGEPPPGQTSWRIGVAPLDAEAPPSRYLRLAGRACSTSGDAFQFVEIGGKRYSHLVDPKTGVGLVGRISVTIVAPDGITADSLASAVCVLGPERGCKLVETLAGTAALIVWVNDAGVTETVESEGWKKLEVEDKQPQVAKGLGDSKGASAKALRELRKPIQGWLARDIAEKQLPENQACADLILAFGLARAGDADEAKKLLKDGTAILEGGDAVHQCLGRLYRHRIEQVLAGKSPRGPLPAGLVIPGKSPDDVAAKARMDRYKILQFRAMSRIVEPTEQVDPYLEFIARGADDPFVSRLLTLQEEQDAEKFGRGAVQLLKDSESGSIATRTQILTRLAASGSRAGDPFSVEVLKGVLELARFSRKTHGALTLPELELINHSLALAARCKRPDLFEPLVAEAVGLIKSLKGDLARGRIAQLMVQCERGFREMSLANEAKAFLEEVAGVLPEAADAAALQKQWGADWPEAARLLLAEAGIREVAKVPAAHLRLDLVRDAIAAPYDERHVYSFCHLVSEYAFACGRLPPAETRKRLEELLGKLVRIPNTRATAGHFAHYHLLILESSVLGMLAAEGS